MSFNSITSVCILYDYVPLHCYTFTLTRLIFSCFSLTGSGMGKLKFNYRSFPILCAYFYTLMTKCVSDKKL